MYADQNLQKAWSDLKTCERGKFSRGQKLPNRTNPRYPIVFVSNPLRITELYEESCQLHYEGLLVFVSLRTQTIQLLKAICSSRVAPDISSVQFLYSHVFASACLLYCSRCLYVTHGYGIAAAVLVGMAVGFVICMEHRMYSMECRVVYDVERRLYT